MPLLQRLYTVESFEELFALLIPPIFWNYLVFTLVLSFFRVNLFPPNFVEDHESGQISEGGDVDHQCYHEVAILIPLKSVDGGVLVPGVQSSAESEEIGSDVEVDDDLDDLDDACI
jgi:hypothetical protein